MAEFRDAPFVELLVDGRRLAGWTRVRVGRSLETLAADFELELKRPAGAATPPKVRCGASCAVLIDGVTALTGWVDDVEPSYDAQTASLTVRGRDRAGDLVDCSAEWPSGTWKNRRLDQIAADLVKPYGLSVRTDTDVGAALKTFSLQPGETVAEALERLSRLRGVLVGATRDGGIRIWRPQVRPSGVTLTEGVDLVAAGASYSLRDRFSRYTVKAQAKGSDESSGATVARAKATASDPAVARHRPLVLTSEDQGEAGSPAERVAWEASVRAARAQPVRAEVLGWRHAGGALWDVDTAVRVVAPRLGVDQELMVAEADLVIDERGVRADLTLYRADAFRPEPVARTAAAGSLTEGRRREDRS